MYNPTTQILILYYEGGHIYKGKKRNWSGHDDMRWDPILVASVVLTWIIVRVIKLINQM
jgi:hypothetical protein